MVRFYCSCPISGCYYVTSLSKESIGWLIVWNLVLLTLTHLTLVLFFCYFCTYFCSLVPMKLGLSTTCLCYSQHWTGFSLSLQLNPCILFPVIFAGVLFSTSCLGFMSASHIMEDAGFLEVWPNQLITHTSKSLLSYFEVI